ncbi:hypothetical protein QBC35DRAFT_393061 [Podospora australis]|uniref:Uncharacterized protein n=1 Tax=Podospora australis TaxID=1536484 RepID=A0AAN6WM32_9PEZI|nr:hypothetical protein QBC35DRAFT_393061 [Podospora australis]
MAIANLATAIPAIPTASADAVSNVNSDTFEFEDFKFNTPTVQGDDFEDFDCDGSKICRFLHPEACDDAVNNRLIRGDFLDYGAPGSGRPLTSACSAIAGPVGCRIHIQGHRNCTRTGNQIWEDYQDIRESGCQVCGTKHWGDGCYTSIEVDPQCKVWRGIGNPDDW